MARAEFSFRTFQSDYDSYPRTLLHLLFHISGFAASRQHAQAVDSAPYGGWFLCRRQYFDVQTLTLWVC